MNAPLPTVAPAAIAHVPASAILSGDMIHVPALGGWSLVDVVLPLPASREVAFQMVSGGMLIVPEARPFPTRTTL